METQMNAIVDYDQTEEKQDTVALKATEVTCMFSYNDPAEKGSLELIFLDELLAYRELDRINAIVEDVDPDKYYYLKKATLVLGEG